MKSTLLTSLAICGIAVTAATSQTKVAKPASAAPRCTITVEQAPALRIFRLGTMLSEIKELPTLRAAHEQYKGDKDEDFGYVIVSGWQLPPPGADHIADLKDVNFTLHFLDEKLVYVHLQYEEFEPADLSEFIRKVASTTPLPASGWRTTSRHYAEMTCSGFEAYLWTGRVEGRPHYLNFPAFSIKDLAAEAILQQRKRAAADAERRAFLEQKRLEQEKLRQEAEKRKVFKP